jgi:hypothetical protein
MRDYVLKWEAKEYEQTEKGSDWFWALGIISVSIAVTSIILNNLLFAAVVIISAFALSMYAKRPARTVHFEVNQRGLLIDSTLYLYNALESFWVEEEEENPKLLIKSTKTFVPLIVAPLGKEVDREELRDYLLDHVDEEEHSEPLSQKIMERLGF